MKRAAKWLAAGIGGLLLLFVLLLLARPLYLDRVYYSGPVTDHFDGERFFNPEGGADRSIPGKIGWRKIWGMATGGGLPAAADDTGHIDLDDAIEMAGSASTMVRSGRPQPLLAHHGVEDCPSRRAKATSVGLSARLAAWIGLTLAS